MPALLKRLLQLNQSASPFPAIHNLPRDLALFEEEGYVTKEVQPVDLFPTNDPCGVCRC